MSVDAASAAGVALPSWLAKSHGPAQMYWRKAPCGFTLAHSVALERCNTCTVSVHVLALPSHLYTAATGQYATLSTLSSEDSVGHPRHTFAGLTVALIASAAQPTLASVHQDEGHVEAKRVEQIILSLPKPPAVEGLVGLKAVPQKGRSRYLPLVTREAGRWGVPTAIADAVVTVESAYDPSVVGTVGELGLMQVRLGTAAMLGFNSSNETLADPETNIRYGVEYLAKAWRLAGGDVCRTLMKYRAGHGEERMTPRSVEYCRRARIHLAAVGSPLANEGGAAGPFGTPVQVASTQPVQLARDPRVAEEQRRSALQRELVQRFILTVARVGSTGKTEPLKRSDRPSNVRQANARRKGTDASGQR